MTVAGPIASRRASLGLCGAPVVAMLLAASAAADVHVQDVARLQGQRTNRLMGYGLVVGLSGTGDGDQYLPTMRALARLHQRFHAPVFTDAELQGNKSVAMVVVEAEIPEHGAREGQTVDVQVSVIGAAPSLYGGQLLTTPLQYAMFAEDDPSTQYIAALAGGSLHVADEQAPTRAVIRGGATLEADFFYRFIDEDRITLVLDDAHAGWPWAYVIARAINEELSPKEVVANMQRNLRGRQLIDTEPATALGPRNVVVRIPAYELDNPVPYIRRVLEAKVFMLPEQAARVIIDRKSKQVAFTGAVTVSPTVLQIPNVGTVLIGQQAPPDSPRAGRLESVDAVAFSELLQTLSAVKVTPDQLVDAIEHLHQTGSLHAQLQYR